MKNGELVNAATYPSDHELLEKEIDKFLSDSQSRENIRKVKEFFESNLPPHKPSVSRRHTKAK